MGNISASDITVSQSIKGALATANWAVALTLLIAVTLDDLPLVYAAWSLVCGMWGATFVMWALLVRERLALERLADIMAAELNGNDHRHVRAIH